MSMTGLRDLSVIDTPPPERYPIKTYVLEYNEDIIAEAIHTEIERKGQVFFVHNRIQDIYAVRERLQELLPRVSIGVGHGRMPEEELSRVITDFLAGSYHIFLCTTIIESGLDMPNVNTIIVDEADRMGLAQLYQLRGRVGRSNRIAYAYLTYKPEKNINEMAQKRLNAIREFNELGAGIKIALRDLEIRGAESILIPEIKTDLEQIIAKIKAGMNRGKLHSIIIVAEGVYPVMDLKNYILERTGQDTRITILGHIQRGGTPTAADRILASQMGKMAVDCIANGQKNLMIAGWDERLQTIPLGEVVNGSKTPELGMFELARVLSI
jgi:hypothetical protein